jgi:hypothetical protein
MLVQLVKTLPWMPGELSTAEAQMAIYIVFEASMIQKETYW